MSARPDPISAVITSTNGHDRFTIVANVNGDLFSVTAERPHRALALKLINAGVDPLTPLRVKNEAVKLAGYMRYSSLAAEAGDPRLLLRKTAESPPAAANELEETTGTGKRSLQPQNRMTEPAKPGMAAPDIEVVR